MLLLLNAEIYGGIGASWSYMRRELTDAIFDEVKKAEADIEKPKGDHFWGGHALLGYNHHFHRHWFAGLQLNGGMPFSKGQELFCPKFHVGAKVIVGYRPTEEVDVHLGAGYEMDRVAQLKTEKFEFRENYQTVSSGAVPNANVSNFGHFVVGAGFNYYFTDMVGLGLSLSYRLPKETAQKTNLLPLEQGEVTIPKTTEKKRMDHFKVMVQLVIRSTKL